MSDWNPSIVRIEKILPHPNADAVEIAIVLEDYHVVVKKEEFKVGELAAYIPVDSVVPDNSDFEFLIPNRQEQYMENGVQKTRVLGKKFTVGNVPENFRIVTAKKFRGIFSQGILMKGFQYTREDGSTRGFIWQDKYLAEGNSIIDLLSLTKWEEPDDDESNLRKNINSGNAEKCTEFSLPYYDIKGKGYFSCIKSGEEVVIEEKIHGCNAVYAYVNNKLWAKSRQFFKPEISDCIWRQIAREYNLAEKLSKFPGLAFWGEIYGQVKKFPYGTTNKPKIIFFDIFDIEKKIFLDYEDRNKILNELGLDIVPLLAKVKWNPDQYEEIKLFAEGKSILDSSHIREGFVLRPVNERFEYRLNGRCQLKFIGNEYLLQKK